jgi:hypothetical protein
MSGATEIKYVALFQLSADFFDFPTPLAAAGDEWINVEQQGELSERSEFSPCRRSSFRHRVPAQRARHLGRIFLLTLFRACKKSKASQGVATPLFLSLSVTFCRAPGNILQRGKSLNRKKIMPVAPGRRPTFLAGQEK